MKLVSVKYRKGLDTLGTKYSKEQVKRIARRLASAKNDAQRAGRLERMAELQASRSVMKLNARLTHLAHMFVKGVPLEKVEDPTKVKSLYGTCVEIEDGRRHRKNRAMDMLLDRVLVITDEDLDLGTINQSLGSWFEPWYEVAKKSIKERCNGNPG